MQQVWVNICLVLCFYFIPFIHINFTLSKAQNFTQLSKTLKAEVFELLHFEIIDALQSIYHVYSTVVTF